MMAEHAPHPEQDIRLQAEGMIERWQGYCRQMLNDPEVIHAMLVLGERMQRFYHHMPNHTQPEPSVKGEPPHATSAQHTAPTTNKRPDDADGAYQPNNAGADVAAVLSELVGKIGQFEARLNCMDAGRTKHTDGVDGANPTIEPSTSG